MDRNSYDMNCLLPSEDDFEEVLLHFAVLVGRMFTTYIPGFGNYKLFSSQIKHKYSTEMGKKSDVVSLVCVCVCVFVLICDLYNVFVSNCRYWQHHQQGKLRGFVPVAQDWHAGQCLLEV